MQSERYFPHLDLSYTSAALTANTKQEKESYSLPDAAMQALLMPPDMLTNCYTTMMTLTKR